MMKIFINLLLCAVVAFGFDVSLKQAVVSGVLDDSCDIYIGNLAVGQSGVIVHNYSAEKSTILANAIVENSSDTKSKIKIVYEDSLAQDALPSIKRKVKNGDVVLLNHLYSNSFIIAPNNEAYSNTIKALNIPNLLNPDIIGAHFKIINAPAPKQKEFQSFALNQHIGILVFVFNQKAHIVDVNSFKTIDTIDIKYDNKERFTPFFTNIEEIKRSLYDFGEENVKEYDEYYEKLLKEAK